MDRKFVEPIPVLRESRVLRIPDIAAEAFAVCSVLSERANSTGAGIVGPQIFVAHGLPRDSETRFQLDFCQPVANAHAEGVVLLSRLDTAFRIFEGPIANIFAEGYQPLLADIAAAGLTPTGESREIYHQWDGPDAPTNRVEIQIAVA